MQSPSSLPALSPRVQSHDPTPLPRVHPHRLTCSVRVLTVFPSLPLLKEASDQPLREEAGVGRPRKGYIPEDITTRFELPRVPRTIVPTFSDEQLQAMLAAPDRRTWVGIRDRAILLVLLDTLIRVSELVGLDAEDVDPSSLFRSCWVTRHS